MERNNSTTLRYAGALLFLAFLLGGGTRQGLWSDSLLQIAMVPALLLGLGNIRQSRLSVAGKVLVGLICVLLAMQFLPLPRSWPPVSVLPADQASFSLSSTLFSISAGKGLSSVAFAATVLGFTVFLARFSDREQKSLIRFLLAGILLNIAIGGLQLSAAGNEPVTGVFQYGMRAGVFANENHYSTLMVMMIPLLAFYYTDGRERVLMFAGWIVVILLFCFALGSRSGMVLSLAITVLSTVWIFRAKLFHRRAPMQAAILTSALLIGTATAFFLTPSGLLDLGQRQSFINTTSAALGDNWVFGTGLGSFDLVYPAYEDRSGIYYEFVNHVHNDYLELALEGGVLGVAIMLLFGLLVFVFVFRSPMKTMAGLSLTAVLISSTVDYPLRTMAVAMVFAFCCAVLFSVPEAKPKARRREDG